MPKLWSDTIGEHRLRVVEAIVDAGGALVDERGILGLTMSAIAERAGIGRATLYKYFPDVESVLHAWHARTVAAHVEALSTIAVSRATPSERLATFLSTYAHFAYHSTADSEAARFLHRDPDAAGAQQEVVNILAPLLEELVRTGEVRADVPARELANYCISAMGGFRTAVSGAARNRLVLLIRSGLKL